MSVESRRRLLGMAAGVVVLAGCFDDNDVEKGDDEAENGDGGNYDPPDKDDVDDDTENEEPAELDIPEPVDWTNESRATIEVGPGDKNVFDPDSVRVETGTTLRWVWMSDGHTLVSTHQLADAGSEGNEAFEDIETVEAAGFEVEFVPETPGEYRYVCEQHEGMVGYLVVE